MNQKAKFQRSKIALQFNSKQYLSWMGKQSTLKWQLTVSSGSTLGTWPALRAALILCRGASLSQKRPHLSSRINRSKSFRVTSYIVNTLLTTKEKAAWEILWWCKTSHRSCNTMATIRFLTITSWNSSLMETRMMTFLMMMRTMKFSTMMKTLMSMKGSIAAMAKITVELSLVLVLEELGKRIL